MTREPATFPVGEYADTEFHDNPVLTVAGGILRLFQSVDRNSAARKLQVSKSRGQPSLPGLYGMRITGEGVRVFPRTAAGRRTRRGGEGSPPARPRSTR